MNSREVTNLMYEVLKRDKATGSYGSNNAEYETIERFIQDVTAELYLREINGRRMPGNER